MDVFSCRVRPGGHIFHEVNKQGITAPEVAVLRHVHEGTEAVYAFVKTGTVDTSSRDEYARLAETYGIDALREVFGPPASAKLPNSIDDDFEDADAPPKPKGRGGRKPAHSEQDNLDDL